MRRRRRRRWHGALPPGRPAPTPTRSRAVIDEVRTTHGRIDVLLHAAGLEISRSLPDKEAAGVRPGLRRQGRRLVQPAARPSATCRSARPCAFSSVAGRFGNAGQTDYSAANDLLCKITSSLRRTRPRDPRHRASTGRRGAGIGMATRGSIPKMMETAGIEMLPPEAGIAWIRRELTAGDQSAARSSLAGALGRHDGRRPTTTGGVERRRPSSERADGSGRGQSAGECWRPRRARRPLDPTAQPFLDDHRIDGTAVLPGRHGHGGLRRGGAALAPELARGRGRGRRLPRAGEVLPGPAADAHPCSARVRRDGDDLVADCRLRGRPVLPGSRDAAADRRTSPGACGCRPRPPRQDRTGRVVEDAADAAVDRASRRLSTCTSTDRPTRSSAESWRQDGAAVGRLAEDLPRRPRAGRRPTACSRPRLVELCFQTAGLWEAGTSGPAGAAAARRPAARAARRPSSR